MKPNQSVTSPLEKGDHPELDMSELCITEHIAQIPVNDRRSSMDCYHWTFRH
jgi:hypothetical protein